MKRWPAIPVEKDHGYQCLKTILSASTIKLCTQPPKAALSTSIAATDRPVYRPQAAGDRQKRALTSADFAAKPANATSYRGAEYRGKVTAVCFLYLGAGQQFKHLSARS